MTETVEPGTTSRRRFLTYLIAAPTLALATAPVPSAEAAVADIVDFGDVLILAGAPTAHMLVLTVRDDGGVTFRLPREEVGQGLTTAVAMLVAEEMDAPLAHVAVQLEDARPELLFGQLTGGSNSIRSLYGPVRQTAAAARVRLVRAAARQWGLAAGALAALSSHRLRDDGRQEAGHVRGRGSVGCAWRAPHGLRHVSSRRRCAVTSVVIPSVSGGRLQ
ncbi:molybdopterin cofactor-binding domain-containing protein [Streptomyces sp. NPDC002537]